jgi:hypothetical protein
VRWFYQATGSYDPQFPHSTQPPAPRTQPLNISAFLLFRISAF